jgi:dolichyl-phosphate-mannose-protein mannosyltransferase
MRYFHLINRIISVCKKEHFWLCALVVVTLGLQFGIIASTNDYILDEAHYVTDANNIIENHETKRTEHPPLAKLFIVAGIRIFGDNPWGWRFFSVIFGTATIIMFYFLCRRLEMSWLASNLATTLLAFENMTFVHGGIAMIDVYYLTFMLASFLLYMYRKYVTSGAAVGLSALAKLNGALALPVIGVHWLFSRQKRNWFVILIPLFAVLAFMILMMPFDLAISQSTENFEDSYTRTMHMLERTGSLTFEGVDHPSESRPWEWLLTYKPMAYHWNPNYIGGLSPSFWALIMPTFVYMVVLAIKRNEAALFGVAWFFGTFLLWIPATFITDRVSYPFYFYPTIGAICIGQGIFLGWLLEVFKRRPRGKLKWTVLVIVILYLMGHAGCFIAMSSMFSFDLGIFL